MKQDGRKLDHRTLEVIRKMAVKRVREGEKPSQVIASHGFARTMIYGWLKASKGRGKRLRALASRRRTGRLGKLTAGRSVKYFAGSMARIRCSTHSTGYCGRGRSFVS
jgi:hypothetical protein